MNTDVISMDELLDRQDDEMKQLEIEIKQLLKTKGISKKELEAKAIQIEYDLKAKHIQEQDDLEEYLSLSVSNTCSDDLVIPTHLRRDNNQKTNQEKLSEASTYKESDIVIAIEAKKAKAQKKKVFSNTIHRILLNPITSIGQKNVIRK